MTDQELCETMRDTLITYAASAAKHGLPVPLTKRGRLYRIEADRALDSREESVQLLHNIMALGTEWLRRGHLQHAAHTSARVALRAL